MISTLVATRAADGQRPTRIIDLSILRDDLLMMGWKMALRNGRADVLRMPPGPLTRQALFVWLLPMVVVIYLLGFAAAPRLYGLSYTVALLFPVGAFLIATLIVAAIQPAHATAASWLVMTGAALGAGAIIVFTRTRYAQLLPVSIGPPTLATLAVLGMAGAVAGAWLAADGSKRPPALVVLVALAVAAMLVTDARVVASLFERDLLLDLRAGDAILHGQAVYSAVALSQAPADPTLLPFVYPPVTLPLWAVLTQLPRGLVEAFWFVLTVVTSIGALRAFGVRWRWVPILLAWPPFVQGIWTGNANSLLILGFALGPFVPSGLLLLSLVKPQLAILALWLPRERRWRPLMKGLAITTLVCLGTLPIVGLDSWRRWLGALGAFSQTSANIPSIQALALVRQFGPQLTLVAAGALLLLGLARRDREGLATLGLASMAASPTLYLHGLGLGLPSILWLRGAAIWFLVAVTSSFIRQQDWWLLVAVVAIAPLMPVLVDGGRADASIHPIGSGLRPWPTNPVQVDPGDAPSPPPGRLA